MTLYPNSTLLQFWLVCHLSLGPIEKVGYIRSLRDDADGTEARAVAEQRAEAYEAGPQHGRVAGKVPPRPVREGE